MEMNTALISYLSRLYSTILTKQGLTYIVLLASVSCGDGTKTRKKGQEVLASPWVYLRVSDSVWPLVKQSREVGREGGVVSQY